MTEHLTNTPHATAAMLEITPVTLRRRCEYHAAHLSAGANPPAGKARRFTGRDLEVFKHVRSLRAQGLTVADINEQLAGLTFAVVDTDEQNAGDSEELASVAAQEGLQQAQGIIVALEAMQRQIDGLQAERANRRAGWERDALIFIIGLGVGVLLLVGVLAAMALWGSG